MTLVAPSQSTTLYACPERPDLDAVPYDELSECGACDGEGEVPDPVYVGVLICDDCGGRGRLLGYDENLRPLRAEPVTAGERSAA